MNSGDENNQYFELIQQYCDNEMSVSEVENFEKELLTNAILKEEFQLYTAILEGIKSNNIKQIRNQFKEIDKQLDQEKIKVPISRKVYKTISIAASIIILLSLGLYFTNSNGDLTLANKYWENDRGLPVFMGKESPKKLDIAMNSYKLNDLENAYHLFKSMNNQSTNDTVNYYLGIIEFKKNAYAKAIQHFENVLLLKESIFTEKAEFRISLCYLALGNKLLSKSILKNICDSENHLFRKQAKQLLIEISS